MFSYKFLHLKICSFALICTIGRKEGAVYGKRHAGSEREERGYLNRGHCMYRERKRDLPPSKVELNPT
jgi:hypothetical protein